MNTSEPEVWDSYILKDKVPKDIDLVISDLLHSAPTITEEIILRYSLKSKESDIWKELTLTERVLGYQKLRRVVNLDCFGFDVKGLSSLSEGTSTTPSLWDDVTLDATGEMNEEDKEKWGRLDILNQ